MNEILKLTRNDYLLLAATSILFLFLTISFASRPIVFSDEPNHLASGYSKLVLNDYRMNTEVPPLANVISALPLLTLNLKDYQESGPWIKKQMVEYSCLVTYRNNYSPDTIFFLGRLPGIAMGLLLGIAIFLIISRLYGKTTAHIVYFLYATHPMILTHSTVVFVDFAFMFFNFFTFMALLRFIETKNEKYLFWFFVLFSVTFLTKFTAIHNFIFYPLVLLLNYKHMRQWFAKNKLKTLKLLAYGAIIFYIIILLAYQFQNVFVPTEKSLKEDALISKDNPKYGAALDFFNKNGFTKFLGQVPNPLPYYLTKGLGHWFFDTKTQEATRFATLPSLLTKNTPVILLLVLTAACLALRKTKQAKGKNSFSYDLNFFYYVAFYVLIFNVLGSFTHSRHILMVYPFIIMLTARPIAALLQSEMSTRDKIVAMGGILLLHFIGVMMHYPNFNTYKSILTAIVGSPIDDLPETMEPQFC